MEENKGEVLQTNKSKSSGSLINLIISIGLGVYFLIDFMILLTIIGLDVGGDMGLVMLSMFLTLASPLMIILSLVNTSQKRKLFLILTFVAILPIVIIFFLSFIF